MRHNMCKDLHKNIVITLLLLLVSPPPPKKNIYNVCERSNSKPGKCSVFKRFRGQATAFAYILPFKIQQLQ
jgi:hypothetical protein